ncbi:MAG: rhodanese-like domain-containing protein [Vampirovibrionales bacterium]|nr:rhodanese-like domain-containing protein [Vampirovibrionales bacterium]
MPELRRGKSFQDLCRDAKARINEISVDDLKDWLAAQKGPDGSPLNVIDVRETEEFSRGAVPTARHISRGVLELHIDEVVPDQSQTVVLYCGGGNRSALAADTLQQMGYDKVYSVIGGYRAWHES